MFIKGNTYREILLYNAASNQLDPNDRYNDNSRAITRFLKGEKALLRSLGIDRKEFRAFKANILKFIYGNSYLYRKLSKNIPIRRIIDNLEARVEILLQIHKHRGHKGCKRTYRRVTNRYQWLNLGEDIAKYY